MRGEPPRHGFAVPPLPRGEWTRRAAGKPPRPCGGTPPQRGWGLDVGCEGYIYVTKRPNPRPHPLCGGVPPTGGGVVSPAGRNPVQTLVSDI
ncbi:MAG: hypothetical protein LBM98_04765 [Oscillospiraceae bacterium]|nr:hypothetical protein [Oscillospiraceae bacterium]